MARCIAEKAEAVGQHAGDSASAIAQLQGTANAVLGRRRHPQVADGGQTHAGRDHNPHGFTMWMAGGGVKPGMVYGATDDFGWKAIEKPVHVHDIHATILYLLGIDHLKLTYRYSGRDFRLTDVAGQVVKDIMA